MKITPIFAPYLFAFCHDNVQDEFNRLLDDWTDIEWLDNFFNTNSGLLNHENITIDEAIFKTVKLAEKLYDKIEENQDKLDSQFRNLDNKVLLAKQLEKQKAKSGWLRLYALRIENNRYVITGGAIKQSLEMKDHPDTKEELRKLEKCREYLKGEGIHDIDSFFELIL